MEVKFVAQHEIDLIWGDIVQPGGSFTVVAEGFESRRVYIEGCAATGGAAPIFDFGEPTYWLELGFHAFMDGKRVYWYEGQWTEYFPSRAELLMGGG